MARGWLDRLQEVCERRGLTGGKLALLTGISRRYANAILSGDRGASFDSMISIARGLGLSLDWLAGVEIPGDHLTPEEHELVGAWRAIADKRIRRMLLQMAREGAEL